MLNNNGSGSGIDLLHFKLNQNKPNADDYNFEVAAQAASGNLIDSDISKLPSFI